MFLHKFDLSAFRLHNLNLVPFIFFDDLLIDAQSSEIKVSVHAEFEYYDVKLTELVIIVGHLIISSINISIIQKLNIDLVQIALETGTVQIHVHDFTLSYKLLLLDFFVKLCVAVNVDVCDV